MGRRGLIVAIVGLGVIALAMLLREADDAPRNAPAAKAPALLVPAPALPDAEPVQPAVAEAAPAALQAEAAALAELSGAPDAQQRATWSVQLLQPDGTPAAGVPWTLQGGWDSFGWPGDGAQAPDTPQSGVTGADGRLAVSFRPAVGADYELKAQPAGLVPERWNGTESAAEARDLGSVRLSRGATVRGRAVDAAGQPLPAGVTVQTSRPDEDGQRIGVVTRLAHYESARTDAAGNFELAPVAPGHVRVDLSLPAQHRGLGRTLDLQEGDVAVVDLVHDGPALDRRIVLELRTSPWPWTRFDFDGEEAFITLSGNGIPPRHPVRPGGWQQLVFDDVPPGVYSLEVSDPAFEPWRRDDVRPGPDELQLWLTGNTALDLQVVDAVTREPVETFGVALQADRREHVSVINGVGTMRQCTLWAHPVGKTAHAGGRVTIGQLEANPHAVSVEAPGYLPWSTVWMGVAPHGRGCVTAELRRAVGVSGSVTHADGTPAPGVTVGLFDAPWGEEPQLFVNDQEYWALPTGEGTCQERASAHTDATGHFAIESAPTGRFVVRAYQSAAVDAVGVPLDLAEGQLVEDVRLVLPEPCWLEGRVALPPGASGADLCVAAGLSEPADPAAPPRVLVPLIADVGDDGRFRLGPAVAGTWQVWISPGRHWQPMGFESDSWKGVPPCARRLGTVRLPQDGEQVFELPEGPPGRAEVQLTGAAPRAQLRVDLADPRAPGTSLWGAWVDDNGVARLGPLWPTEARVTVSSADGGWSVEAPDLLVVPAGGVGTTTVRCDVVDAELVCLDAVSGEPLVGAVVVVYTRSSADWRWQLFRTDEHGSVRLQRLVGELRVQRGTPEMDKLVARSGESWQQFMERSFAEGHPPMQAPKDVPPAPAADAIVVPWKAGSAAATVRL